MKKVHWLVFFSFMIFSFVLCVGCYGDKLVKEDSVQEFKLLAAHIEFRDKTNSFGGITSTEKYFNYVFTTNEGEILIKEKEILNSYYGNYILKFEVGKENKILQYNNSQTLLKFVMTEEMWSKVFDESI